MIRRFAVALAFAIAVTPALAEQPAKPNTDAAPTVAAPAPAEKPDATVAEAPKEEPEVSDPQALVMDIAGTTEPEIAAFDELGEGATVKLDEKTELALTFYPTCEDVTIRGGTVSISNSKLMIDKGEIISRAKGECPGHVKLSPADVVNASVVTRTVKAKPWISPTPLMIGVTGPKARFYDKVAVYSPDGAVFEAPLDGKSAVWPQGTPPLEVGKLYTVVLTGADIQMFAARVVADAGAPRVTVFRLQ